MNAWKKTVALLMALGMTFSIVACGDTESSSGSSTGSTDGGEINVPKTETEMFKYVMDAIDATNAYTGSIAMTMEAQLPGGLASRTMSFDAVNKLMYMDEIEEEDGAKNEYYCKTFVQGGKLYGVEKGKFTPAPDSSQEAYEGADYFEIHDNAKAEYQTVDYSDYMGEYLDIFSGLKLADNPAEVKAAFDTVLPVMLASQVPEGAETTITSTASATGENGVYTFALEFEGVATITEDNMKNVQGSAMTASLSAKDGKLVALEVSKLMTQKTIQTDGTTETTLSENSMVYSTTATIDYAFAQAKYDAVTVTLPTNAEEIEVLGAPAESYSDLELYIYGIHGEHYTMGGFDDSMTAAQVLESIISGDNHFAQDRVEIKAYKDEACTQELTASAVTEADILALTKVYLKATPKTGYAIVNEYYEERYDYSKPYQIVMSLIMQGSAMGGHGRAANAYQAGEYTLNAMAVNRADYEIWVDGVKMSTKTATITLESGRIYEIKYIKVVTDPVVKAE